MKKTDWLTSDAREFLDLWWRENRQVLENQGMDPDEVRADLESHLWMERRGEYLVNLEEVEEALEGIDLGISIPNIDPGLEIVSQPSLEKGGWFAKFVRGVGKCLTNRFWAGVWPVMVVAVELLTGVFGSMMFDPVSRLSQAILVSLVSIFGLVHFFGKYRQSKAKFLTGMRAAGSVVAGYWGVVVLPVIVGLGYFFFQGLIWSSGFFLLALPFVFICCLIAAAPIFLCLGFLKKICSSSDRTWKIGGLLTGVVILAVVEGPAYFTRYGVAHEKPNLIRSLGSEEVLLTMCYEGNLVRRGYTDTSGFLLGVGWFHLFDFESGLRREAQLDLNEKSREMFYRVTGRSFESEVPPDSYLSGVGRGMAGAGVEFDDGLGGDRVALKLADLDLVGSRLDGHIDGASRLGYWEWTMEFDNFGDSNKEARMQILLPNGGVVSRLTLWVNDQPQEAAFASTAKVERAYRSIAVKESRDPVLVRWVGDDRVLVQCFPVLPEKNMKIRIGVTAPLDAKGRLFLPRIIEQNFGIREELNTNVWVQGDVSMSLEGLQGESASGKWREAHGELSLKDLMARHTHVRCEIEDSVDQVWARDSFSGEIWSAERVNVSDPSADGVVVLVIDGSEFFERWVKGAEDAIGELRRRGYEVRVVVAAEDRIIEGPSSLSEISYVGGQDSLSALESGFRLASSTRGSQVVWLHGESPVVLGSMEPLFQYLERGLQPVRFKLMDLEGGSNRILESLSKRVGVVASGRPAGVEDLQSELLRVVEGNRWEYKWKVTEDSQVEGVEVWDQLVRWRVWQQVRAGIIKDRNHEHWSKLAAKYQLVTPVSGAVVLETEEQFERFGLDQIDPSAAPSIPSIPEPSTGILLIFSSLLIWRRRRLL